MGFRRRRWRDVKPEEEKVRINHAIRAREVRVVNEDGQQLGVMSPDAARDVAGRLGLDLVEIAPTARPPVCKIMDYGRYKYELKKKASSAKKSQHQSQVKEIKLRPQINEHDLDFKLRNARKFLFDGDKVKFTVMFRGREIQHTRVGEQLLESVATTLAEIANAESRPQMEGRFLSFTIAPNRAAIEKQKKEEAAAAAAQKAEEAAEGAAEDTAQGAAQGAAQEAAHGAQAEGEEKPEQETG